MKFNLLCIIIILVVTVGCTELPPTPSPIVMVPTEECEPGASYVPNQGCTVTRTPTPTTAPPLHPAVTSTPTKITPTIEVPTTTPTPTPTPIPHPQFKLEGPRPLIIWLENDPWRMVIGSDSPAFALYEDGQVIFLREDEFGDIGYVSTQLSTTELDQFLDQLAIDPEFFKLDLSYEVSDWTDQPSHTLLIHKDHQFQRVQVYGDLRGDAEAQARTPRPFLELVQQLSTYDHPQAVAWTPDEIEIMVWPYDVSDAFAWPEGWPDLEHPNTWHRGDHSYSIYLNMSQFEQLWEIVEEESPSAFLINDRTWTYGYRYPFLNEHLWMWKSRFGTPDIPTPTPEISN